MKKIAWVALISFIFVLLAGCIVYKNPGIPPPPRKKEVRIVKPGAGYVWIGGYWRWTSGRYVWVKGHWVKAPRGKVWAPGRWVKKNRQWVWVRGRWVKAKVKRR